MITFGRKRKRLVAHGALGGGRRAVGQHRVSGMASRAVGLSQRLRLEWLDEVAELAWTGRDRAEA